MLSSFYLIYFKELSITDLFLLIKSNKIISFTLKEHLLYLEIYQFIEVE